MKKLLLIGSILCASVSYSQIDISRDVFASTGSEMSNATLHMSYTIGETFTSTLNPSSIHSLGFQQGDLELVSVHELNDVVIALFPNPADQQITFTTSSNTPFAYHIYDVTGRIVLDGNNANGVLTLDISSILEGKYIIEYIPESGYTQYLPFITHH
jgi:Secretion system C-terminal sorting domain